MKNQIRTGLLVFSFFGATGCAVVERLENPAMRIELQGENGPLAKQKVLLYRFETFGSRGSELNDRCKNPFSELVTGADGIVVFKQKTSSKIVNFISESSAMGFLDKEMMDLIACVESPQGPVHLITLNTRDLMFAAGSTFNIACVYSTKWNCQGPRSGWE